MEGHRESWRTGRTKILRSFPFLYFYILLLLIWEPRTGWYPLRRAIYNWGPVRTSSALIIVTAFENADFQCFRPSTHTNSKYAERFHRIDLKTLLKGDQNENAYISYYRERSKKHQSENDDRRVFVTCA